MPYYTVSSFALGSVFWCELKSSIHFSLLFWFEWKIKTCFSKNRGRKLAITFNTLLIHTLKLDRKRWNTFETRNQRVADSEIRKLKRMEWAQQRHWTLNIITLKISRQGLSENELCLVETKQSSTNPLRHWLPGVIPTRVLTSTLHINTRLKFWKHQLPQVQKNSLIAQDSFNSHGIIIIRHGKQGMEIL